MSQNYEQLENASGLLFSIGAIFSKLQFLPINIIRIGSNVSALLAYWVGYVLWIAACQQYPSQERKNHHWYTFAEFKSQFTASAIVGSIAVTFSLLSIINPTAFVLSAWLMVVSNFLWVVGERNKMANPPEYRQLPSLKHQETNFNYATIVLSISTITACSVTAVIVFPLSATYIVSLTAILTTGLTLWSFEHILENWFPMPENKPAEELKPIPEVNTILARMKPQPSPRNEDSEIQETAYVDTTPDNTAGPSPSEQPHPEHQINCQPF